MSAYPTGSNTIRPPHIHFRLSGHDDELVTQMYFEGEALNEHDRFLQNALPDRRPLLVAKLLPPTPEMEPNSRLVVFDIVTLRGGDSFARHSLGVASGPAGLSRALRFARRICCRHESGIGTTPTRSTSR